MLNLVILMFFLFSNPIKRNRELAVFIKVNMIVIKGNTLTYVITVPFTKIMFILMNTSITLLFLSDFGEPLDLA